MQLHQQFLIQLHWSQHIKNSDSLCSSSPITCLQMAQIHNFNDHMFFTDRNAILCKSGSECQV